MKKFSAASLAIAMTLAVTSNAWADDNEDIMEVLEGYSGGLGKKTLPLRRIMSCRLEPSLRFLKARARTLAGLIIAIIIWHRNLPLST
jgi:hypothetical protein